MFSRVSTSAPPWNTIGATRCGHHLPTSYASLKQSSGSPTTSKCQLHPGKHSSWQSPTTSNAPLEPPHHPQVSHSYSHQPLTHSPISRPSPMEPQPVKHQNPSARLASLSLRLNQGCHPRPRPTCAPPCASSLRPNQGCNPLPSYVPPYTYSHHRSCR